MKLEEYLAHPIRLGVFSKMKVLDPGHKYLLNLLDDTDTYERSQELTFVKRNDPSEKYPGNFDSYPGVQTQEVIRVLIDRMRYVHSQRGHYTNTEVIDHLRAALWLLEARTRDVRHQEPLDYVFKPFIEFHLACKECGHIRCLTHEASK